MVKPLVIVFNAFVAFIVLLIAIGIKLSACFHFINSINPRNATNAIILEPGILVYWDARRPGSWDAAVRL